MSPAQDRFRTNLDALAAAAPLPPLSTLLLHVAATLATWDVRRRTRRALRHLSDAQLRDCGLTYDEAISEAHRPFWRG